MVECRARKKYFWQGPPFVDSVPLHVSFLYSVNQIFSTNSVIQLAGYCLHVRVSVRVQWLAAMECRDTPRSCDLHNTVIFLLPEEGLIRQGLFSQTGGTV